MRPPATWPSRTACASTSSACPTRSPRRSTERGSDYLVEQGYIGDFAITGEPTDLHIGIQAKGVLAMRIEVTGTSAHGSTPWIGDNAVLKAIDVFRQIESLPFARESSDLFDRPSINLGRIMGGDALNKVPDLCVIDVDVRYLPGPGPRGDPRRASRRSRTARGDEGLPPPARRSSTATTHTCRLLGEAIARVATPAERPISVGRDGASDAISFLEAGVPAVECGPAGAGHHGPEEWVSIRSLGAISAGARGVREPATGPAGAPARTTAACGSPDVRGDPPPRTLEALLIGGFLIIFAAAGGHRGGRLPRGGQGRERDQPGPELQIKGHDLATTDPGKPQTLMILGSDRRPKNNVRGRQGGGAARTRSCSSASTRTRRPRRCMSLPRDLKVEIPGHGTDKINAAYELGGPQLTVEDGEAAHRAVASTT